MKHWLYVSAIRGRMTEYYLLPCSKRSDVLTTVDSFCGSIPIVHAMDRHALKRPREGIGIRSIIFCEGSLKMIAVGNKKERFFAKPRWSSLLILLRVLKGIGVLVLVCLIVDKLYDMKSWP